MALLDLERERFRGLLCVVQVEIHLVIAGRPGTLVGQVELELAAAAGGLGFVYFRVWFRALGFDRYPHRFCLGVVWGVGEFGDAVERLVGGERFGWLLAILIPRHLRVAYLGRAGAGAEAASGHGEQQESRANGQEKKRPPELHQRPPLASADCGVGPALRKITGAVYGSGRREHTLRDAAFWLRRLCSAAGSLERRRPGDLPPPAGRGRTLCWHCLRPRSRRARPHRRGGEPRSRSAPHP